MARRALCPATLRDSARVAKPGWDGILRLGGFVATAGARRREVGAGQGRSEPLDGQRFDTWTRAMANGATRRRALRLAGGGLAGAVLAAVGVSRRAGARQDDPPCGQDPRGGCGGRCPRGRVCAIAGNPANRVVCLCVTL